MKYIKDYFNNFIIYINVWQRIYMKETKTNVIQY